MISSNKKIFIIQSILLFLLSYTALSQVSLTGSTNYASNTDANGMFEIKNIPSGNYVLTISHLGFKTTQNNVKIGTKDSSISIILEDDPLRLQTVVITGNFEPRTLLESSTAVTTLGAMTLH